MPSGLHLPKMAIFVAVTLVLQAIPLPPICGGMLRLVALPIILSGLMLGPKSGFWVGAISDVLGFLILPHSSIFFPGFTLTQGLTGAIPALIVGRATPKFWRYLWAIAVGQSLTKFIMVPLFLLIVVPIQPIWTAYKVLLSQALITQIIHIPLYSWILWVVMRHLDPILTVQKNK